MGSSNTGGGDKDASTSSGDNSSGGKPPASDYGEFSEGERVLAYHGPRIYEAKVQKTEVRKKEWRYFVHYLGWNKNWDEWVGMERLMKLTEENILKQQALDKKQGAERNTKSGRSSHTKPKSSADAKVDKEDLKNDGTTKRKKQKIVSANENDNARVEKVVKIQIPSTLKKQLVDDWEFVSQQDKLVKLPRSPTVDDILTKYLEYKLTEEGMTKSQISIREVVCGSVEPWLVIGCLSYVYIPYRKNDSIGEILKGLRCYFDRALPMMLLYKKERQQYHEFVVDNVSPSTIYGAEHLLRLFVKLPELLAYVNIEEETLVRMQHKLTGFLKFLQKNQNSFFLSAYKDSKGSEKSGNGKES